MQDIHRKWTKVKNDELSLNVLSNDKLLAYELKNSKFKVNAVCPGYTKTDFNGHRGHGRVEEAGKIIIKYALIDNDGPTGKFFSEENNPEIGEVPW